MELREYPNAIAQAELELLGEQQRVRELAKAIEARKAQFGAMVAEDATLTNEAKRKAARAELELTDVEYLKLQDSHQTALDRAVKGRIEVDRLVNMFRVERLFTEQQIASLRTAA